MLPGPRSHLTGALPRQVGVRGWGCFGGRVGRVLPRPGSGEEQERSNLGARLQGAVWEDSVRAGLQQPQ